MSMDIQSIKQRYGIVGNSPLLARNIEMAIKIAPTNINILVSGENGVGKEVFARIIHDNSARKHGPFFTINCGAIPEGTIDSELFGHVKGAFTDARQDRKGYFEEANNGTLFLDEIGELPRSTQARLLRVIEYGEYVRMGESQVRKTNVRIVAASNVNLPRAIEEGHFRQDLYYRLNGVEIHVPALRERREDIPLLFRIFSSQTAEQYNTQPIRLTEDGKQELMSYHWGGNIRQLKHFAEQISVMETEREVSAQTLRKYLPQAEASHSPVLFQQEDTADLLSERKMLYQVIAGMQKDIADLQKHLTGHVTDMPPAPAATPSQIVYEQDNTPHYTIHQTADVEKDNITDAEIFHEEDEPIAMDQAEKENIVKALKRFGGSRKQAAQALHISERTLYRKIKEFNLQ